MNSSKFDIEKFTGKNDFGLWKMKMEAVLIQQGLEQALLSEKDLLVPTGDKEKEEFIKKMESIQSKAYSSIILSLSDPVLRKVSQERTVSGLRKKLEDLCRTKALPNRIYASKSIEDSLDDYDKLILDLENLDIKIDEEDKAVILLNSLPNSLKHFKETLKYGRETIPVEDIQNALNSKLLDMKTSEKTSSGQGLNVRGRVQKRD
ncbi:hypothetical protein PanWU01x14_265380, partial [Parasponia andersonii]